MHASQVIWSVDSRASRGFCATPGTGRRAQPPGRAIVPTPARTRASKWRCQSRRADEGDGAARRQARREALAQNDASQDPIRSGRC
jgi:hypothetical protein